MDVDNSADLNTKKTIIKAKVCYTAACTNAADVIDDYGLATGEISYYSLAADKYAVEVESYVWKPFFYDMYSALEL